MSHKFLLYTYRLIIIIYLFFTKSPHKPKIHGWNYCGTKLTAQESLYHDQTDPEQV